MSKEQTILELYLKKKLLSYSYHPDEHSLPGVYQIFLSKLPYGFFVFPIVFCHKDKKITN